MKSNKPLEGILVLEFSQFMAGPSAGLKLADLGARVIKIERPGYGESGRQIAIKNLFVEGSSLVFHTINRNKESFAANLKDESDLAMVRKLIASADVLTHNFRPGVMEKIGLDYQAVKSINDRIVYATVTGYGTEGPWSKKPGQDLLAQSMSGLAFLTGDKDDPPTPMGMAVADIICGSHLVTGILSGLVRRAKTGKGAQIEVSLLESVIDFQFEVITTWLNDGKQQPQRAGKGNAHAYLGAPYGIYPTKDGYLALAMGSLITLSEILNCPELKNYSDPDSAFDKRDEIMDLLRGFLVNKSTKEWLAILEPQDVWCSDVLDYASLTEHEGYKVLGMDQEVILPSGEKVHTTRCPIRLNDEPIYSPRAAPGVGEHTADIINEFKLQST